MNQFNTPVKVLYYLSEFLIYPWATAFKRLVCQVKSYVSLEYSDSGNDPSSI